ncbi:MAG TPA: allantoinase AllB [Vicinamibacterales bacterium]|jgi:allantoinase|nr:allantoinase AllB [Vicinamibacterales bacterium]
MSESSAQYTLRSTRVVLPQGVRPACIRISHGRIDAIAPYEAEAASSRASDSASRVYDHGDLVIMAGLVDAHVHVNEPGRAEWEGFQTATAAAAAGGVTTIVDMPLNSRPATTTVGALTEKRAAARNALVRVEFWGGVVPGNARDVAALAEAGVRGFKCFLSPSGVDDFPAVEERDLRPVLPILRARDLPLLVHAEWPPALHPIPATADPRAYSTWLDSRPPNAEIDAIALLVSLCREFGTRIHVVHLSAAAALPFLREARAGGLPITVETCPHYLTFCAEEIPAGATLFKCAPPVRDGANREALWRALEAGDIDFIATDHSPCPPSMKGDGDFVRAWGGIASLELILPAIWTAASARGMALERVAAWLSAAPAAFVGIAASRGTLAVGKDADLVVWDPDVELIVDERRLRQRHKRTPYAGRRLRGRVIETYVEGRLVYREGVR